MNNKNANGFYRGTVLKHLNNGYCKIFIHGVYPDEWNTVDHADEFPNAEQASMIGFGNLNHTGFFSYPSIGSTVWVFFANNDYNYPVYFATSLAGEDAEKENLTAESSDNIIKNQWDEVRAMPVLPGSDEKDVLNIDNDAYYHKIRCANDQTSAEVDVVFNNTGSLSCYTQNGENSCYMFLDSNGNISLGSTNKIKLLSKEIDIIGDNKIVLCANDIEVKADGILGISAGMRNVSCIINQERIFNFERE